MIDLTNYPKTKKGYGGANGGKKSILFDGERYMIKFPPVPAKNKNLSYGNNCVAEHIGCQIFRLLGIPAQETFLATYTVNNKKKIVVACKDFTSPGVELQDFASMKNQAVDSVRNGYGTELDEIIFTFSDQNDIRPDVLSSHFWDMFVVDALIGNWDRHNGNWGFLYDVFNDSLKLAPIYDCGSSLFPQADQELMQEILENQHELNYRIFEIPTSAIKINDKRINYFKYISSLQNEDCNKALMRIVPRINMSEIEKIIDEIPCIDDLQKRFYKTMLAARKERILDFSLELLQTRDFEKLDNRKAPLDAQIQLASSRSSGARDSSRQSKVRQIDLE